MNNNKIRNSGKKENKHIRSCSEIDLQFATQRTSSAHTYLSVTEQVTLQAMVSIRNKHTILATLPTKQSRSFFLSEKFLQRASTRHPLSTALACSRLSGVINRVIIILCAYTPQQPLFIVTFTFFFGDLHTRYYLNLCRERERSCFLDLFKFVEEHRLKNYC